MNENLDLDELREKLRFAQSVPSVELVMKLIQELEEIRAKHRKEWGRAEAAEAAVQRVREVATGERTAFGWGGAMGTIIRALDGDGRG